MHCIVAPYPRQRRRHRSSGAVVSCDCSASSVPFTNIQTYLLTYLPRGFCDYFVTMCVYICVGMLTR